jgi:hypothetical protein
MRLTALLIVLTAVAGFVAGCGCTKAKRPDQPPGKTTGPGEGTTLALLPADNELEGWALIPPVRRYVGHELYVPIDGAADAFFQFEFREAAFGLYRNGESMIQLEIYKMASPDDACGIASQYDNVNAESVTVGGEGRATIGGGRMHLAKGPYFLIVQHAMHGRPDGVRAGMVQVANAVAAKIEEPFSAPKVLALLPDGYVSGSVRYFRTPMTQGNLFYITYDNVLGLRPETFGVAADYDTITTEAGTKAGRNALFAIAYPSPDDAPRVFEQAAETLAQEPFQVLGALTEADAQLTIHKDGKLLVKLGCTGGMLYGAWDIENEARVDALLAELAGRIRKAARSEETP